MATQNVTNATTKEQFDQVLKDNNDKLIVIEFSASWCGYCELMEPVVEEYAQTYPDVHFVKLDWDEMKDQARQYGVRGFPTFVLQKNRKKLAKIVGAKKEELAKKISQHKQK